MHFGAIERQELRQRAHDVGPLFRQPGFRLFGRVDPEVVQAERSREPEQRQVVQDLQLLVRERQHGVPRLHLRDGVFERHLAVPGEARERHREVLHERRVHHVAEIDDADDLVAAGLRAQQVVGVAVAVHDLRAQAGRRGRTSRWKRALKSAQSALASSATQAWMPGSKISPRWMSQATKWRACGWKNPCNPRVSFAWNAAAFRSAPIPSGLLCESGVPGIQLSTRTMWRLPSSAAIHSRSLPRVDAMRRGTGRSGA